MPIFETGYRHWSGRFLGPIYRWFSITKTIIKISFRAVIIKRFIWFAWMPAIYFAIIFFLVNKAIEEGGIMNFLSIHALGPILGDEGRNLIGKDFGYIRHRLWERIFHAVSCSQIWVTIIVAGIVGSPLVANDIKGKSFLIYYSRPITLIEYFIGKCMGVLFFIAFVTLLPNLLTYIVSVAFSPSLQVMSQTYDIIWKAFISFIALGVPVTIIVLFFSSLTSDARFAAFGWFALCIGGEIGFRMLSVSQGSNAYWISFPELERKIFDIIYNVGHPDTALTLGAIGILCIVAIVLTFRKITAPIRL